MLNIMFVLELNINITLKLEENAFTEQLLSIVHTLENVVYKQRTPSKMGNCDLYSNQLLPFLF